MYETRDLKAGEAISKHKQPCAWTKVYVTAQAAKCGSVAAICVAQNEQNESPQAMMRAPSISG